jgi:hypothetical protein
LYLNAKNVCWNIIENIVKIIQIKVHIKKEVMMILISTLEVSQPSRLTEKVVTEQHEKALAKFKKFMETGMFKGGGKISNFDKLSAKVAKQYEGKPVKSQYQEEYGKYYSKEEAQEVGDKVAGKVKAMQPAKKEMGGETKKMSNGREMLIKANQLAKEIRKDGESWNDAKKRAFAQLKK